MSRASRDKDGRIEGNEQGQPESMMSLTTTTIDGKDS
jgi:hypothetical protein